MLMFKLANFFGLLIIILGYYVEADNNMPNHIIADLINNMAVLTQKYNFLAQKYDQIQDKSIEQGKLINNLNVRVNSLEEEVAILTHFKEINEGNLDIKIKNDTVEERISHLEEIAKIKVLRSCEELHQHGVSISGYYHIDPDGENIGFPPIRVHCDFENLVTEIIHDSDNEFITIDHCMGGQCFEKQFIYAAPIDQITSLIQLSSSCSQILVFDCFLAPLSDNNVQIGTWTDRFGQNQVYFNGANYGQHMCSCYSNNSCVNQQLFNTTCNCDATGVSQWMEDAGVITNMTALPITAFNYGPLEFETQEAKIMVGRLRCSGIVDINSPPTSCNDLKKLGETRSGLYPLHDGDNDQYPKLSYCVMSVAGYDGDIEKSEGWIKFSSGPGDIVFAVQHTGANDIPAVSTITYNAETINEGNCMNKETGTFTAVTAGIYEFSFSAICYPHASGHLRVDIYVNGNVYAEIFGYEGSYEEVSKTWILNMEYGNTVQLILIEGGMYGSLYSPEFTGKLI